MGERPPTLLCYSAPMLRAEAALCDGALKVVTLIVPDEEEPNEGDDETEFDHPLNDHHDAGVEYGADSTSKSKREPNECESKSETLDDYKRINHREPPGPTSRSAGSVHHG